MVRASFAVDGDWRIVLLIADDERPLLGVARDRPSLAATTDDARLAEADDLFICLLADGGRSEEFVPCDGELVERTALRNVFAEPANKLFALVSGCRFSVPLFGEVIFEDMV